MATEKKFWNKKYSEGGISGRGSIGRYRNWKWNQIQLTCGLDIRSLIDVGCGDLSFWKHPIANKILTRKGFKYTGIDVSDIIIKRNRSFAPEFDFICAPAHIQQPGLSGQLVLALDLLFHIMDDGEYEQLIETLCEYTLQHLVIYTWKKNPFLLQNMDTDGRSQKYRPLGEARHIFAQNDMNLVKAVDVPYDEFGKLFIFRRVIY